MADRVSVPSWIRIRGKGTTVGELKHAAFYAAEAAAHNLTLVT